MRCVPKLATTAAALALVATLGACAPTTDAAEPAPAPRSTANAAIADEDGTPFTAVPDDWAGLPWEPVTPTEYRAQFMEDVVGRHHLGLDGILERYREAATAFPFALPEGWVFPADPGYYDRPQDGPNWSITTTLIRVENYWTYAWASEGREASATGDAARIDEVTGVLREFWFSDAYGNWYADASRTPAFEGHVSAMTDPSVDTWGNHFRNPFPWEPWS